VAKPSFEHDFQGNKAYSLGFVTVVTSIRICLTFILFFSLQLLFCYVFYKIIGTTDNSFQFLLYLFKIFWLFYFVLMFSYVQLSLNKLHLNKSPQVFMVITN